MHNVDDIKQVIVVRKDLKMRKGKLAAQVAHAAMKMLMGLMRRYHLYDHDVYVLRVDHGSPLHVWLGKLFTKVVVGVDSLEELERIKEEADSKDIPFAEIIDSGKTEFHGEKTPTCVAIGPEFSSKIDEVTGGLTLL